MIKIKYFEEMTQDRILTGEVNHTIWWAYNHSQEAGNELLNFDDVIWEYEIKEIFDFCKKHSVKKITISSGFSNLNKTVYEFIKMGAKLVGMTEVNARYNKVGSKEKEKVPAFVLEF